MRRMRDMVMERLVAGSEDGLTVVEVIVAGVILTIGSLGVLGMVDTAGRNTFRVEQSQLVNNVLQREMEEIRELPYEEIGLSAPPAEGSGENDPSSRVLGAASYTNRNGTGLKPFVFDGSVVPGPESFQIEDVTGSIYRYVVWDDCPAGACVDGEYLKRVIIAVKLDATASGGADRRYQEIQSQIVDPEAEPSENPGPAPGGATVTPWFLWLTDTTCVNSSRLELEGDHLAHNTRGVCATGMKPGNEPGAPDLLWNSAPPLTEETPVYDYALDVEPDASPDTDKGLQLMLGNDCGAMPATTVATVADADPDLFRKLHKWVTPAIPATSTDLVLTGDATLNLWTQSIEGGLYPATICVWLFVRSGVTDTPILQALESRPYATYSASTWPSSKWNQITVPIEVSAAGDGISLPPGSRLGVALSVDDGSGSGIQILYDEPSFDTRLRLETIGTLPSF